MKVLPRIFFLLERSAKDSAFSLRDYFGSVRAAFASFESFFATR